MRYKFTSDDKNFRYDNIIYIICSHNRADMGKYIINYNLYNKYDNFYYKTKNKLNNLINIFIENILEDYNILI